MPPKPKPVDPIPPVGPGDGDAEVVGDMTATKAVQIPKFSDESVAMSAKFWCSRVENYIKGNKWSDKQAAGYACEAFRGRALEWHQSELLMDIKAHELWTVLKLSFLDRFSRQTTLSERACNLHNLSQASNETVKDFLDRVNKRAALALEPELEASKGNAVQLVGALRMFNAMKAIIFVNGLEPTIRVEVEREAENAEIKEICNLAARAERSMRKPIPQTVGTAVKVEAFTNAPSSSNAPPNRPNRNNKRNKPRGGGSGGGGGGQQAQRTGPRPPRPLNKAPGQNSQYEGGWIWCWTCKQWGRHFARDCKKTPAQIASLTMGNCLMVPGGEATDEQGGEGDDTGGATPYDESSLN